MCITGYSEPSFCCLMRSIQCRIENVQLSSRNFTSCSKHRSFPSREKETKRMPHQQAVQVEVCLFEGGSSADGLELLFLWRAKDKYLRKHQQPRNYILQLNLRSVCNSPCVRLGHLRPVPCLSASGLDCRLVVGSVQSYHCIRLSYAT